SARKRIRCCRDAASARATCRNDLTRSLYILRHGKAEELQPGGDDHQRALKRRGQKAAGLVGHYLTRLDEAPELVLCSSAVRARGTGTLARGAGGWRAPIELCPEIYSATSEALVHQLRGVEPHLKRVLLVGHQPTLSLLIAELTGSEPEFPTAALARVD